MERVDEVMDACKLREIFLNRLNIGMNNPDEFNRIKEYLDNHVFFGSPASTRYHESFLGGLCFHSLKVHYLLREFFAPIYSKFGKCWSDRSIAVTALLHDVCKSGCYSEYTKNVKNDDGVWVHVPAYKWNDEFPMGHGEKSVIILLKLGINLSEEEIAAINWHMGFSDNRCRYSLNACSESFRMYPLFLALHQADQMAATMCDDDVLKEKVLNEDAQITDWEHQHEF